MPLFFTSGAVGLVYQVVWLRQLILVFGATAFASSAVLSTFMGGLALGSWWAGRRADAWTEPPLRTYGKLELAIAAYGALVPWLMSAATPVLELAWRSGAERHFVLFGFVKFIAIAVLILPATTLMGATLPVLSRAAASRGNALGSGVGSLYAANTMGAVVGTAVSAFVLLPQLGTRNTTLLNVLVNAIVGAVAWWLGGRDRRRAATPKPTQAEPASPRAATLTWVFAVSGFAAMVLEVAWTRGLALVLGSSVYAYAAMLTAFLLGLASGAAVAARRIRKRPDGDHPRDLAAVLLVAGVCSLATAHALLAMPRLFGEVYYRFDPSPDGWFLVQLGVSLLVMFPTTFALGWVFPLVLEIVGARRGSVAASVGRVYAANTAGTIAGAAAGGFLLLPHLGVSATLVAVAVVQALLGGWVALGAGPRRKRALAAACAATAVGLVLCRPSWDVLLMNSGVYMNVQNFDRSKGWSGFLRGVRTNNELVYAKDGLTASVLVGFQPADSNLYLAVNGKTDASSREDLETQIMAGHLPLLVHRNPKDVLVVGLASGISVGSVATHPVESIKVVEIEAAIVPAARLFHEHNGAVLDDPRVSLSINDARNELQFNTATYDVIVSEPSNPWMTVASNLFTEDYFRIAKARLRSDGVFAQWIQTYSLGPEELRSILAAFRAVFPDVAVFETLDGVDLLLLGSSEPIRLDVRRVEERMSELRVRIDLGRVRIRRPLDILGMYQTGGAALDAILVGARKNTDDNGLVEFAAPKSLYLDSQAANTALLQTGPTDPVEVVRDLLEGGPDGDTLRRDLITVWRRRGHRERAEKAAKFLMKPPGAP